MSTPSKQILISNYPPFKEPSTPLTNGCGQGLAGKVQNKHRSSFCAQEVRMYSKNDGDMLKGQLKQSSQWPTLEQFEQQNK